MHEALVDAIEKDDRQAAEDVMIRHISVVRNKLLEALGREAHPEKPAPPSASRKLTLATADGDAETRPEA